jgi:hypothetical protein
MLFRLRCCPVNAAVPTESDTKDQEERNKDDEQQGQRKRHRDSSNPGWGKKHYATNWNRDSIRRRLISQAAPIAIGRSPSPSPATGQAT